jgi:hypothetical protein
MSSIFEESYLDVSSASLNTPSTFQHKGKRAKYIKARKPSSDIENILKRQRLNNIANAILAVISIVMIYYSVSYMQSDEFYRQDTDKPRNSSNRFVTVTRLANIFLTLFLCNISSVALIYRHYRFEVDKLIVRNLLPETATVLNSGLKYSILLEMSILGIVCPPYLDTTFSGEMLSGTFIYSIDMLAAIISMSRLLLVGRLYIHISDWLSDSAFILGKKYSVTPNILFALKADVKHRPYLLLGPVFLAVVVVIGFIVRSLERPYESEYKSGLDFEYITNAWWMTVVTMATVGYGDGYPSTHLGRFVMITAALIALVLISLYVVTLTLGTNLSKEESAAYYVIKKMKAETYVAEKAADIIKAALRLMVVRTRLKGSRRLRNIFIQATAVRKEVSNFNRMPSGMNRYMPAHEMLIQIQQRVISSIQEIQNDAVLISYIGEKLEYFKVDYI